MLRERMQLVINNHRYSCSHTDYFIYILKGFEAIESFELPFSHLKEVVAKDHAYIYLEEWDDYKDLIHDQLLAGYRLALCDFNFFSPLYLSKKDGKFILIAQDEIDLTQAEYVPLFNMNNPLIGVSENLNLSDQEKIELLKEENLI